MASEGRAVVTAVAAMAVDLEVVAMGEEVTAVARVAARVAVLAEVTAEEVTEVVKAEV